MRDRGHVIPSPTTLIRKPTQARCGLGFPRAPAARGVERRHGGIDSDRTHLGRFPPGEARFRPRIDTLRTAGGDATGGRDRQSSVTKDRPVAMPGEWSISLES